ERDTIDLVRDSSEVPDIREVLVAGNAHRRQEVGCELDEHTTRSELGEPEIVMRLNIRRLAGRHQLWEFRDLRVAGDRIVLDHDIGMVSIELFEHGFDDRQVWTG